MSSNDRSTRRLSSPLPWSMLAVLGFALVAIIAGIWAVRSHGEVEALEREIAELRSGANASVFELTPTEIAPDSSRGQVFITLTGSGVVVVSNLPQPGDNEEFRLWYLHDDDRAVSGGAIHMHESGQGFALVPGDMEGYSRIAVSLETRGTDAPEGNYLLIAEVKPGRG